MGSTMEKEHSTGRIKLNLKVIFYMIKYLEEVFLSTIILILSKKENTKVYGKMKKIKVFQ